MIIYVKIFPKSCTFDDVVARYRRVDDHQLRSLSSSEIEFDFDDKKEVGVYTSSIDNSTFPPTLSPSSFFAVAAAEAVATQSPSST